MRKSFVTIAVVVAVVAGVAVAWAAIPSSPGAVFTGCVSTATATKGALRVIDAQAGDKCKATEKAITWNQRGVNWRSTWASGTAYAVNDAVAYQGSSYIATAASTGVVPTNIAKWAVLAQKGTTSGPAAPKLSIAVTTSQHALVSADFISEVIETPIPAGKQLVQWHATLVDFGPANTNDIFRCEVFASDTKSYSVTTASAATWLNSAPGQGVQTISSQVMINPPDAATLALYCSHDTNLPSGNYYVDPGASISAIAVS